MHRPYKHGVIGLIGLTLALAGCSDPIPLNDGLIPPGSAPQITHQVPTGAQSAAMSTFAERLLAEVMASNTGQENPVISPLSAFLALAMVGNGAQGDTAKAFATTLGVDADTANAIAAWAMNDLAKPGEDTTINLANSAWFDSTLSVKQPFVDEAASYYQADVYNRELATKQTRSLVNRWVKEKTEGLIPSLLDNPIDPGTLAMLINTVYFKAAWQYPFSPTDTKKGTFTKDDKKTVSAWYMSDTLYHIDYISTTDVTGALVPYKDGRLGYLVILPKNGGLDSLQLTGTSIARWLTAAQEANSVTLKMPKFHTEFGVSLTEPLKAMGLGSAFADSANFASLSDQPVRVSDVVQKVTMDVGEKGTEASAATVVVMAPTSAQIDVELSLTRPYLYGIIDTQTGLPLFLGAMTDTSKAEPTVK